MKKVAGWVVVVVAVVAAFSFITDSYSKANSAGVVSAPSVNVTTNMPGMYDSLQLDKQGLSREAFNNAVEGYTILVSQGKVSNDQMLSIIDFSLPSSQKRLFVIDMLNKKVLFNTYVSHGRNSGTLMASDFSNDAESLKSSLGFYLTKDTYKGKHGYSLRLEGEEKGINDHAFERGIVMHSAGYVNESLIRSQGYIGRSEGCPAIPPALHKAIITKIKNGSCLYIYSPDSYYASHSVLLNKKDSFATERDTLG
ncbi:MAG: murein L,D-transpeptidase catalytic domain family protein [Filimonas sp.]|nr:murein L,D-transpeptidase catalytic domain family protein [Filimonas sp.]